MDKATVDEIIACLPKERTLFHYFRDRYALLLLAYAAGRGTAVSSLRASSFGQLLNKPVVRNLLAGQGGGTLGREQLENHWEEPLQTFLLTLGSWGGRGGAWDQVSRPGHNLVLRLNFNHSHDRSYQRLVRPRWSHRFNYQEHPILRKGERPYLRETLAWARIDLDLATGEALIEEIQSDWVRRADAVRATAANPGPWLGAGCFGCEGSPAALIAYAEDVLSPYAAVWEQAMLCAAIRFIREELGVRRIWYHTWETGAQLKRVGKDRPPRSLYTKLPRRFCFSETAEAPGFLLTHRSVRRRLKEIAEPRWFYLQV